MNIILAIAILISGSISMYNPGRFEEAIANRQAGRTAYDLPLELPEADGYAATLDPALIGSVIWLRPRGQHRWYSFLVADCAGGDGAGVRADGRNGAEWMQQDGVIAEIDPATWRLWKSLGWRGGAEMSLRGPTVQTRINLD